LVASYLTFFPVTIAALRGLRSADPRAYELMRSLAAGRREVLWKLRLPASAPYLFTALKIAASAAVVGAIVGELPAGIRDGLGGALLNFNQYYTSAPERLWAAILVSATVGIISFGLVVLAERYALRGYQPSEGSP
jgi:NitT/TauT family transport system permease protein